MLRTSEQPSAFPVAVHAFVLRIKFRPRTRHCQQFYFSEILDRMLPYMSLWVSLGMMCPLLLAVGAVECSEKETLLKPIPSRVTQPSDCLMECTGITYIRKQLLQDNHNIRLKDSTEGDVGEYCWSTELKCNIGESFVQALVVLPVDISAGGHERLVVKASVPDATLLHAHDSPTTIAESCGLRYDVTQHFSTQSAGTSFCIHVVTQEGVPGDKLLKCPPYMVTFWQRNPTPPIQRGDR